MHRICQLISLRLLFQDYSMRRGGGRCNVRLPGALHTANNNIAVCRYYDNQ